VSGLERRLKQENDKMRVVNLNANYCEWSLLIVPRTREHTWDTPLVSLSVFESAEGRKRTGSIRWRNTKTTCQATKRHF
jgi:hypothetical protein